MSIKTMAEVWKHSSHKGSELLLLLAIADYAHDDGTNAYPSVETLASKTRITTRAVRYVLRKLEASGELVIENKQGPNGVNIYGVKTFHPEESRIRGVKPVSANPSEEEPLLYVLNKETWPEFYRDLWGIPGMKTSLQEAEAFLVKNNIPAAAAQQIAASLVSWWPGPQKLPRTNPFATFRSWCLKEVKKEQADGREQGQVADRPRSALSKY